MNENLNELEVGLLSNNSRYSNKKMRKRKHLDALIKFRSTKRNSNEICRSSEDELFLSNQTSIQRTKTHSSLFNHCYFHSKQIASFCLICIFIIVCISLISVNVQLKNQVDRLSIRIDEIENRMPDVNMKNLSSILEQFQIRLNFLERWKHLIKNRLTQRQLDEETATNVEFEYIFNEKIQQLDQQLAEFRNQIKSLNQNTPIVQLNNLVQNSSDKTSIILNEVQSNLDQLKFRIDQCNCSIIKNLPTVEKTAFKKLYKETKKPTNPVSTFRADSVEQIVN